MDTDCSFLRNKVGRKYGTHGRGEDSVKDLVEKPEERRPLRRTRRGWEDGIRMDLRGFGWISIEWIQLAQDRDWWRALVNTVMNLRVLAQRS
jgi:hypothetical protein